MTRLDKPLRREIHIKKQPHVLTISPEGLKLTKKARPRASRSPGPISPAAMRRWPPR
jgi:hypothetical protein